VKSTSSTAVTIDVRVLVRVVVAALVAMIVVTPGISRAAEHRAASAADVARVEAMLRPGDTLVLQDGAWTDQRLTIAASGTPERPITVRPRTAGKAVFGGSSSITLAGEHLVLSGMRFKNFTGAKDDAAIAVTGTHCRVTECSLEGGTSKFYVHLVGPENRLDHCFLAEKTSDDPTVQVEAPAERPSRTRIDHNHFGHRPPLGRNGGETIRLGYSHQASNIAGIVCESNLFESCDGELEIVSNKSSENVYRYNTFLECAGTLTLRHGDRCVVDANYFIGHDKPETGGIRVLGEGQVVTNNYIEGVQSGPILITAGVTNPEPKDHAQARNCIIAHNTIVDSAGPYLMLSAGLGTSPRRTLKPEHITLANNVFSLPAGARLFNGSEGEDFRWFGNFAEAPDGEDKVKHAGVKQVALRMARGADGLWRPGPESPVRGAAVPADADALFPASATAHLDTDIDGQPRRVPTDAGCDEISDQPVINHPLTAADVGPSWLPRAARGEVGATTRASAQSQPAPAAARSAWVSMNDAGRLAYKQLPAGDRVMDFSYAGYRGGGVALPRADVVRTVASPPVGGEDDEADHSAEIQEAIDAVSLMPLVNGVRGAVLLEPGTYRCSRTLMIRAAGVVLRGSGSGNDGTVIELTRRPHIGIRVRGPEGRASAQGEGVRIIDKYVPSGANSFTVADARGFKPGDEVILRRPVTAAWVHFMGMDSLTRNGERQMWVHQDEIRFPNRIRAVEENRVTLDVPLSDSIDAKYVDPPGATLVKAMPAERITEVGIESLRVRAPAAMVTIEQPLFRAIEINAVNDAWMRDVAIEDTVNSVSIGGDSARLTLKNVRVTHRVATLGSAKPADFTLAGTQILVDRCEASGNSLFQLTTYARTVGPNVALNCTFGGDGRVQPHQRWATGLLLDNCAAPDGGIDFMNRGAMGSGHGWTIGWAVAWNCTAKSFIVQQPPGTTNWAIGCSGALEDKPQPFGKTGVDPNMPRGTIDSHGTRVSPKSLYLAQLRERLGPKALEAIGYSEGDAK
jgi:hypothetical protein